METLRMCVACREMKDKRSMIRVVKDKEGNIFIDPTGKKNGRGAYVCKDKNCFNKLKKQKSLNKAFKCNIDEKIINQLEEEAFGKN